MTRPQRTSISVSHRRPRRSAGCVIVILCLAVPTAAPHLDATARAQQPARSLDAAERLADEARSRRRAGKYDEALALAERVLAIRERELGPGDHLAVADALHLVALILDNKGAYDKAEPINRRALAIREKLLGPDHPDVALSLFNLAWLAKVRQDFAQAESLYQRTLDIQERALGPDHADVATTLNDLAVFYSQRGEVDRSIAINERVLAIRERTLGPDDAGVAKTLNNLARGWELKADYRLAEQLLLRALAIWERALGADHPDVANAADGLARVYATMGNYAAAEPLYRRALAIRETSLGPDHTEVATTLNNLAVLYRQMGDYSKAEPLLLRDLAITEKQLGPDHAFVAPTLINLALVYQAQDQISRAEPLYRRALAIQERVLGPRHAAVGVTLNRLAQLLARHPAADGTAVEALFRRAQDTLEQAVGADHPAVAASLSGLAALASQRGDWRQAETHYARALAIQERVYGPRHFEVAQSLERLADLARTNHDLPGALTLLTRAHEIRERDLSHNLPLGSDRQKIGYTALFAADTDRAVSLHVGSAPDDQRALRLALTTVLGRKGRALDASSDSIARLRRRADVADGELFDRLAAARSQLAAVTLRGPGAAGNAAFRSQVEGLEAVVDRLEGEVSARSAPFQATSRPVTIEAIQRALPADAALIEYAVYRPYTDAPAQRAPARYAAYVLDSQGGIGWVDLGDAERIQHAVAGWRQMLRDPRSRRARRLARELDALVMQPVRAKVGAALHLLIAADGVLNLIPFAALVDEHDRYLVERYTITHLTSGRDLLRLQVQPASRQGAVVVAAPAFGEPAVVESDRAGHASGRARPQLDDSRLFFGPLPGVSDEVRALTTLLPDATFLTGLNATESALRGLAGPRLLHIATHGFFLAAREAAAGDALLRSGLALAGANQGRSGEDDGVLTALEAVGLDLWGTQLVVLSACDTGVGDILTGDGVYGLRRALVLAGAESQLMSLWPVSDRSTRELMVNYYRFITNHVGRGEALRRAQLALLGSARYAHPYYWASFIQSGAWKPLRHVEPETKNGEPQTTADWRP